MRSDGTTPIKDTPPITPSIVASGLGTKHAVRCCKDNEDEDEEDWIVPPKLTSGKCLVRTLKQQWTGERGVDRKHFNPQQQIGFSKYPERKCPIKQQEGDKKGEGEALDRKEVSINRMPYLSFVRNAHQLHFLLHRTLTRLYALASAAKTNDVPLSTSIPAVGIAISCHCHPVPATQIQ